MHLVHVAKTQAANQTHLAGAVSLNAKLFGERLMDKLPIIALSLSSWVARCENVPGIRFFLFFLLRAM